VDHCSGGLTLARDPGKCELLPVFRPDSDASASQLGSQPGWIQCEQLAIVQPRQQQL
jgi:hypothetical protein